MLRRFPGRFLDEIDNIDWGRHVKAFEAQAIESIEETRAMFVAGDIPTLPPDIAAAVVEHDKLIGETEDG